MDDDGLLVILLVAGIFILPFVAIWWVFTHPKEFVEAILSLIAGILVLVFSPQLLMAWLLVTLTRDAVVKSWPLTDNGPWVQRTVVMWWTLVPTLFGVTWFAAIDGWNIGEPLFPLISGVVAVVSYFSFYFDDPPKHPNWPKFLRAEKEMGFDLRMLYIWSKTRFKLWFS